MEKFYSLKINYEMKRGGHIEKFRECTKLL